jgi:hypothetical protein
MPDGLAEWRAGVDELARRKTPPAPWQYDAAGWRAVVTSATALLKDWGEQAEAAGWSALDLFGVHPRVGATRHDCAGLVLCLEDKQITEMTAAGAKLLCKSGATLTFRPARPLPAEAVPLWDMP